MKKVIAVFVLHIFVIDISFAQDTKSKLAELDFLTGYWLVTTETRLSANGPWESDNGTAVITKTTGASAIEEDYTGILQNKSFMTKSIIAYNRFSQKFQRMFIDSEHGVLIDYQGEKKADTIYFDNTWIYPDKSTVQLRVVYKIISPDEFIVENMRMPQNTSSWDVTGRMRYVRKK